MRPAVRDARTAARSVEIGSQVGTMVLEPGDPHHDGRLRRGTSRGPSAPCFMQRVRREGCGLPGSAGQRSGVGGRGCAVRSFPREAGVAGDAEGLRTETGGPGVCGLLRHLALTAVVVPSRAESFSRIPLDAFADRGSLVVATAGRPAELVTEPHTGFTASPASVAGRRGSAVWTLAARAVGHCRVGGVTDLRSPLLCVPGIPSASLTSRMLSALGHDDHRSCGRGLSINTSS